MSWQDQGRKEHGWFGDGTAPGTGDGSAGGGDAEGMARRIQAAVRCSVAALPAVLRQRASAQLDDGGLSRLSGTMAAWCRGLGLGKAAWAERMLGRDAADPVAGRLHEAALAVASGERDGVRQAAESLAAAMQVVGSYGWPRFVADAQARAAANAQVIEASYSAKKHSTASAHSKPASSVNSQGLSTQQNVYNMGKMIESEAGGKGRDAKTAVAWALRNRMLRNNSSQVSNSWHGFAHSVSPTPESLQIARGVLDGSITDTTGGATHFYTPDRMPAKGEATIRRDVGGGLESVPEVKRKDKPVETYRPGWANDPGFEKKPMPTIPEKTFKFYKKNGNSYVP